MRSREMDSHVLEVIARNYDLLRCKLMVRMDDDDQLDAFHDTILETAADVRVWGLCEGDILKKFAYKYRMVSFQNRQDKREELRWQSGKEKEEDDDMTWPIYRND